VREARARARPATRGRTARDEDTIEDAEGRIEDERPKHGSCDGRHYVGEKEHDAEEAAGAADARQPDGKCHRQHQRCGSGNKHYLQIVRHRVHEIRVGQKKAVVAQANVIKFCGGGCATAERKVNHLRHRIEKQDAVKQ
jgi:hypothetical protein